VKRVGWKRWRRTTFAPATDLRRLVVVILAAGVLGGIIAFVIPPSYVASSSLLLDSAGDGTNLINLAQLSDFLPAGALPSQSRKENGYAYLEVSRSRALLAHLLGQPRLSDSSSTYMAKLAPRDGSEAERTEVAIRRLRRYVTTKFDQRSGMFQIQVRHPNPRFAADIANQMILVLKRFNLDVRASKATDAVLFVGQRFDESKTSLSNAEDRLAGFQEANARIGHAPGLTLQQRRLERSVKLGEDIYLLLARQLELARVQEKKESPVFTVVDRAVPPTRSDRFPPLVAALLAAFLAGLTDLLIRTGAVASRVEESRRAA